MKIRTDMERIFREITSFVVNVGVFVCPMETSLEIPENLSSQELLHELHSLDTEVVFYGSGSGDFASVSGLGELIEKNGHRITDDRSYIANKVGEKNCVLIGCEVSDIDFFRSGVFSVASRSAPFDLKVVSSYVSNSDGEAIFTELGNLIVNSKKRD